jgi:hypothetical protein
MLCRYLRLNASPTASISGEHDLASHLDAATCQLLIVCWDAIVDIDQRGGDITISRVGVIGGKLIPICRIRVFRERGLL